MERLTAQAPVVRAGDFDAVLFDLDGVLTTTWTLHAAACKRTFDDVLANRDARHGTSNRPFDGQADDATYVDGKPRQEGVRDFLRARGIELPEGDPDSPPDEEPVWASPTASSCWSTRNCSGPAWRCFPARSRGCASSARPG